MRTPAKARRGVPASQRRLRGARGRQGLCCFVCGARRLAGPRPPGVVACPPSVPSVSPRPGSLRCGLERALGDMVQQAGNSVVHAQNSPPSHRVQGPVLCASWGPTLLSGASTGASIEGKNRAG